MSAITGDGQSYVDFTLAEKDFHQNSKMEAEAMNFRFSSFHKKLSSLPDHSDKPVWRGGEATPRSFTDELYWLFWMGALELIIADDIVLVDDKAHSNSGVSGTAGAANLLAGLFAPQSHQTIEIPENYSISFSYLHETLKTRHLLTLIARIGSEQWNREFSAGSLWDENWKCKQVLVDNVELVSDLAEAEDIDSINPELLANMLHLEITKNTAKDN